MSKLDSGLDRLKETQKRVDNFAKILESIEVSEDKKKLLWKEIYQNAVVDRSNAGMLFTEVYKQMQSGIAEHVTAGPILSKYLERMCKSNEQLIKLAEMISKAEEKAAVINPDDIFSQIKD